MSLLKIAKVVTDVSVDGKPISHDIIFAGVAASMRYLFIMIAMGLFVSPNGIANVNVYFSTSAPTGIQQELVGNLTSQYVATSAPTNFFPSNTDVKIFKKNPNFQPPPSAPQPLDPNKVVADFIAQSTTTYVYGFSSGMGYQQHVDIGLTEQFAVNCSTPEFFGASTATWSSDACSQALFALDRTIYALSLSTPPVIPPPGF